jgi:hypothetical protein
VTGYLRWKASAWNKRWVTTALTSPAPWPTPAPPSAAWAARRRHWPTPARQSCFTGMLQGLTDTDPTVYCGLPAGTLTALTGILLDLVRLDDVQSARQEADLHSGSG